MKLLPLFPALALAGAVSAFADTNTDNKPFFSDMLQMDRERNSILGMPDFSRKPVLSGQDSDFIASLKQQQQQQTRPDADAPAVILFVSFSMPEDDLRERVKDAADQGVSVTLRGMVNGDMRQTGTRIAQLVKETNKGGMQIDPLAFRRYGVNAVPTVIVQCGKQSDRVRGDITLHEALKKVAADGDCADFADRVLHREVAHD